MFSQNIGLGTTTPEARLHIRSTGWIKTIFENDASQPRGYIGTDNNGTVTLAANAFWNGSAWVYPNAGASFYMMLHRVNNQFEFRVRPDGGNQNTAMVINQNGNVGIGTASPQAPLEIGVGGNRFLRFKNDLVPTLEVASTNSNDALAGAMRLRNVLEIWPNSGGTQAGKLDVRNAAGNATITLNGSTGIVQANSVQASSVNATSLIASGGIAGQSLYAPNMTAYGEKKDEDMRVVVLNGGDLDAVLIDGMVDVPAAGILIIRASIDGGIQRVVSPPGSPEGATIEFKLDQYTPANVYMTTLYKLFPSTFQPNPTVEYQLPVASPGSLRFKYKIYMKSASVQSTILNRSAIKFTFIPNTLNVQ